MIEKLTAEELDLFEFLRSRAWCGTNWEKQEKGLVELILEARTPAKKPLLKKIFPFL